MVSKDWLKERIQKLSTGCWVWKLRRNKDGYGLVSNYKRRDCPDKAHRLAWFLWKGDPGEQHVLHRCDNRACCNPAHLFLGNIQSNTADMIQKGRNWRPFPVSLVKQVDVPPSMMFMAA